jgi:hypothetical protein
MKRLLTPMLFLLLSASTAFALWEPVSNPGEFENIQMFLSSEERLYAGTTGSKVYGSTDLGDTWTEIAGGLEEDYGPIWDMVIVDDWFIMSRDFFETFNFRSHRVGGVWQPWEPLPVQEGRVSFLSTIGSSIFGVFYSGGVRRSDDHGWSWTPVEVPGAAPIWKIFTAGDYLFASEDVINGGTIYRSDDLGETWTDVGAGLGSSYVCSEIVWQGRLLVCVYNMGGDGTFWSSTDFGDSWEVILTLPTDDNINGMAIAGDGRLAIGDSSGYGGQSIWLSHDLLEWENYNGDLNSYSASFNSLLSHDGWFFKTGGTVTTMRAPHPDVTGVEEGQPGGFTNELSAWPNPFNPKTSIRFTLEAAGRAELDIFDPTGRRVIELFSGQLSAGSHELNWQAHDADGRALASGVYLARLTTADGRSVEKLLLLQ